MVSVPMVSAGIIDTLSPILYDWEPWYVVSYINTERVLVETDKIILSVLLAEGAYHRHRHHRWVSAVSANMAKRGLQRVASV